MTAGATSKRGAAAGHLRVPMYGGTRAGSVKLLGAYNQRL